MIVSTGRKIMVNTVTLSVYPKGDVREGQIRGRGNDHWRNRTYKNIIWKSELWRDEEEVEYRRRSDPLE